MLDPMTAMSLASSVVQFVDFGGKMIFKVIEMKRSLQNPTPDVYDIATQDLLRYSKNLRDGLRSARQSKKIPSENDKDLEKLCDGCIDASNKLLSHLKSLKASSKDRIWKLTIKATRTLLSKEELEEMSSQLNTFRNQLQLRVFVSFKETYDLAWMAAQQRADQGVREIIAALIENRDVFESITEKQTKVIGDKIDNAKLLILDAVKGKDPNYEVDAKKRILKSLSFDSITARYSQVVRAHATTFEWVLKEPLPEESGGSDFTTWLKNGTGIYWVSGKAGSGKSTLMKYIYDHETTRKHLVSWSNDKPLEMASFFFWNSGTTEQKSQKGLLRSLLYEILRKHKDLIPLVMPVLWREQCDEYGDTINIDWSIYSLIEAIDNLAGQSELRMCLFIDGLDEYETDRDGTFSDLTELFQRLASSNSIKICVSSRPLSAFEDAFQAGPHLRLEKLTYGDIVQYVNERLGTHQEMVQLRSEEPDETTELVNEISKKASGVFLWVTLVVKSLLEGLTKRDQVSDLQKRLRALPLGLEDFYRLILMKQIDPLYHQQSSRIFLIVRAALEGLYNEKNSLDLVTLAFADEADRQNDDYVFKMDPRPLDATALHERSRRMAERLKSRCAGLLEVSGDSLDPSFWKVDYLHRTVKDFLQIPEIDSMIQKQSGERFDPMQSLVKAHVLQIKLATVFNSIDESYDALYKLRRAIPFAYQSKNPESALNIKLLNELDKAATVQRESVRRARERDDLEGRSTESRSLLPSDCHWTGFLFGDDEENQSNFLCLAIQYSLADYVADALQKDKAAVSEKKGRPLLDYVKSYYSMPPSPEIVALLLQHGADPNAVYKGRSMWNSLLSFDNYARPSHPPDIPFWKSQCRSVLKQLLQAGANPHEIGKYYTTYREDESGKKSTPIHLLTIWQVAMQLDNGHDTELKDLAQSLGATEVHKPFKLSYYGSPLPLPHAEEDVLAKHEIARQQQQSADGTSGASDEYTFEFEELEWTKKSNENQDDVGVTSTLDNTSLLQEGRRLFRKRVTYKISMRIDEQTKEEMAVYERIKKIVLKGKDDILLADTEDEVVSMEGLTIQ